ncbi:hypothetical protein [Nocardioides sp. NPDC127503]|uniref:hypothetical protein n=1 Tax=Nocardioides sp. NPDC127503 TaxID=3154516 RepID=UPI00332B5EB6
MNAPSKDIHERVHDEIQARIDTLRSGAPATAPNGGAWTQDKVAKELAQLERDQDFLVAHWRTRPGGSLAADHLPMRALACGEPQTCAHVEDLAKKYCP